MMTKMKAAGKYGKRLTMLLFGALALVLLSYQLAFRKTIEERKLLLNNRSVVESIRNSSSVYEQMNAELTELKENLEYVSSTDKDDQEIIIELINKSASQNGIKLVEMPEMHISDESGFYYNEQTIVLQGDFFSLLMFTKELERAGSTGKIASAEFFQFTDKKSGDSSTRLRIYMQNIKAKEQ